MSLNQLLKNERKPWLNIRVEDLVVDGTSNIQIPSDLNVDTLTVNNDAQVDGVINAGTSLTTDGNLETTGDAVIGSNLIINGESTFNDQITVEQDAIFNGGVNMSLPSGSGTDIVKIDLVTGNLFYEDTPSGSGGSYKMGTFEINGTGPVVVNSVGFQPKLLKIYYLFNIDYPDIFSSVGESDGTNTLISASNSSSNLTVYSDFGRIAQIIQSSPSVECICTLTSFDPSGFTLNCTQFSGFTLTDPSFMYTAFG